MTRQIKQEWYSRMTSFLMFSVNNVVKETQMLVLLFLQKKMYRPNKSRVE